MKRLLTPLIIIISLSGFSQHMAINTQYMYQGQLVNPAITGSRNDLYISFTHRNQWLGNKKTPKTNIISAQAPLKHDNFAVGAQIYQQSFNNLGNQGIAGFGAYRIKFPKKITLSFGLKVGVLSYGYQWDDIETITPNDPSFTNLSNEFAPMIGFGTYFRTDDFYVGLGVPEIVNGLNANSKTSFQNWNTTFIAGYIFNVNERISLLPNILVRKFGNLAPQPDFTAIVRIDKKIDIGLILRSGFQIVGTSFDILLTKQIQLGYSFDVGIRSNNPLNTYGNHELSLSYEFKKIVKTTNTKFF